MQQMTETTAYRYFADALSVMTNKKTRNQTKIVSYVMDNIICTTAIYMTFILFNTYKLMHVKAYRCASATSTSTW